MRHFLRHSLLFILPGVIVLSSFLAILTPVETHAATTNPQDTLKKWLYYRGMRACLSHSIDNVTLSKDEVNAGKWNVTGKSGFGYLGPSMDGGNDNDGTVSCDDGSIWVRGATTFGFPDAVHFFCGIASGVVAESKGSAKLVYNGEKCEDSSKFKLAGLNPDLIQRALTDALERTGDRPKFEINDNTYSKAMLYLIGARSLETFCGGGVSLKNGISKQTNDDNRVLVDIANADGTVDKNKTYFLKGDRDEDSKVDDIYYNQGGDANNAKDLRCHEMATMTRDYSNDYRVWASDHPEEAQKNETEAEAQTDNPTGADETTCAVDGIGWIVCPVMTFLGKLNDLAFGFLNNFLEIRPAVFNDAATKLAWSSFRNIANVAFVIAFLVIIYSQITGAGMANYGLKKLIPKLIIAAILVNISFYVCAVLIDLSNIAGSSLYSLLTGFNIGDDAGAGGNLSSIWSSAIAALLGVAIGIGLLALIIFAPMSLLAFAVVILILIARQALVILLIVISPLAFVAYLLPNTEDWFKKWWKALTGALMVYPIIAVVFGASTLASTILMRVAEDGVGGGDDEQMLKIIAAAVLALPLFAVPTLLKGSMAAAGTIGAKLSGLQDKTSGRATRAVKEGRLGEAKTAFDAQRQSNKINRRLGHGRIAKLGESRKAEGKIGGGVLQWAGTRQKALDESRFASTIGADRGRAAATNAYNKELFEETERQMSTMGELKADQLLTIGTSKNESAERRAAAFKKLETVGGDQHIQAAYDYLATEGAKKGAADYDSSIGDVQQLSASSLLKRKPAGTSTSQGNSLQTGTLGLNQDGTVDSAAAKGYKGMLDKRVKGGAFGPGDYARMGKDDLIRLGEMSKDKVLTDTDLDALTNHFAAIESDETLKSTLTPERRALFESIMTRSGPKDVKGQDIKLIPLK